MERVYIGMGSNLGDRQGTLLQALKGLGLLLEDLRWSSLWETEPMIVTDQPSFLNMAASGRYGGSPEELLHRLWELENRAGRNRRVEQKKGPRPLDLDILLFGERTLRSALLEIPHPGVPERAFVLVPLGELEPSLQDPRNGTFYSEYLGSIENQGFICYKKQNEIEGLLHEIA